MVPYSKGVMRLNPVTGDRFRHGEIREDKFVFDHYNMGIISQTGFIVEQWRSPTSFNKKYKAITDKVAEWLDKKKLRKGCQHCGYKKRAIALQWHHVDPSTKNASISEMKKNNLGRFKKVVKEIWKCIILCANCHLIEEKRIRDENSYP